MKIQTLIVDDMKLARARVKTMLAADPDIEVVGECADGDEAVEAIVTLKPELVFLDIQMPGLDGFGVVAKITPERMPAVIFITAYDEFALKAFEVSALDYLLKPFEEERFVQSVNRAKREIRRQTSHFDGQLRQLLTAVEPQTKFLKRLIIKSAEQTILVKTDDIDWIGAAGNYLELHIGREIHLTRKRISTVAQNLDPEQFARIHRSTIVNLDRIKSLHPLFNGDQLVTLRDGTELSMSRTYHEKLFELLQEK